MAVLKTLVISILWILSMCLLSHTVINRASFQVTTRQTTSGTSAAVWFSCKTSNISGHLGLVVIVKNNEILDIKLKHQQPVLQPKLLNPK